MDEQVVLVLVGLIASGKSTFAQAVEQHFPQFRRCNQDELGRRQQVESLARQSLQQGHSVCIDRTNIDAIQRAHWINIAREFAGTVIWVIVFDTPYEICAIRLGQRVSHPTIRNPEQGLDILRRFSSTFEQPMPYEGYDRIITIKPDDHRSSVYTHTDIAAILQRVRDSPQVLPDSSAQYPSRGQPHSRYRVSYGRGRGEFGPNRHRFVVASQVVPRKDLLS